MEYTSIAPEPSDPLSRRVRAAFREFDQKARLSGNTALVMALDRIPMSVLGSVHCVPESALERANAAAVDAMEQIAESAELQRNKS